MKTGMRFEPPLEVATKTILIKLPAGLHKQLKVKAVQSDVTIGQVINTLVNSWVNTQEEG